MLAETQRRCYPWGEARVLDTLALLYQRSGAATAARERLAAALTIYRRLGARKDAERLAADLAHRRRLSVKPGLTCLWQVSGRNNVRDFRDWVRLDLEYIDNWSLWLDLKILVRTVPVVLIGTGAR